MEDHPYQELFFQELDQLATDYFDIIFGIYRDFYSGGGMRSCFFGRTPSYFVNYENYHFYLGVSHLDEISLIFKVRRLT